MANHHFGKLADVWKHLVVDEVLAAMRPARYAETHAGSAAYPMVRDAERGYGVLGFLDDRGSSPALSGSVFAHTVSAFVDAESSSYPGSALQAMTLLGDDCTYLLCDVDPVSVRDLRTWADRLHLTGCEVADRDGLAAVRAWLADRAGAVVHVDPFDPFAREHGGPSAVELAAEVAETGQALVYWYGFSAPDERAWAVGELAQRTRAPLWCGDLMVAEADGSTREGGHLGEATTPGTGFGVVLAGVPGDVVARCEQLAAALVGLYEDRELPDGKPGRLDLAVVTA